MCNFSQLISSLQTQRDGRGPWRHHRQPDVSGSERSFNESGTGNFGFGIACTTRVDEAGNAFANDIIFQVANPTIAGVRPARIIWETSSLPI
jgi:hypothetical protein